MYQELPSNLKIPQIPQPNPHPVGIASCCLKWDLKTKTDNKI